MKTLIRSLVVALTVVFGFSCSEDDSMDGTTARVNFYLVDAPGDYDEVWVEVLAVEVKMADPTQGDADPAWIEIPNENADKMLNLLDLTGSNAALLGTEEFPEGEIDQLRLVLGTNNYVMKGEVRSELTTPSAQQSGLKIQLDQELEAGVVYDLVIDFDVAKSIVNAGASGSIILKPVLRAYLTQSAGISGQVLPVEAQQIQITATGNTSGKTYNTFVDENGNFKIQGLDVETYTLEIVPNELYVGQTIEDIEVVKGEITILDPITLDPVTP